MSAMIFQERKHFLSTVQCATESSVEWLNRLQMAAMRCDFGDHLNEFLVTHFICGLASVAMFERLCGAVTKPIPLERAFELAVQCERDLLRRSSKECQTERKEGEGGDVDGKERVAASADDTDAAEAPAEAPTRPQVRRISRFLVSPSTSILEPPPAAPQARKISRFVITPAELPPIVPATTKTPTTADPESPAPSQDSGPPSAQPSETCSPVHKLSTSSTSSQCSAWEQLKIGLENITHAQVPSSGGKSKDQLSTAAHSPSRMELLEMGAELGSPSATSVRQPLHIEIGDTRHHHHHQNNQHHQHQHQLSEILAKTLSPTRECGAGDKPRKKRVHSHPRFVLRQHDELQQPPGGSNATSTNSSYARFSYFEMDTIDMEYPRNLDSNIEMLGIEAENLEKAFADAAEEKLMNYVPELVEVRRSGRLELDDDEEEGDEDGDGKSSETARRRDEDDPIGMSPCKRFFKYDKEVGYGSFKTVFRGLDTHTGVAVAWCELLGKKVKKAERLRFREEADMLKKLQNSNIVRFYDYWETSANKRRSIVLVTELMLSGTLKSYLKRFKRINSKVFKSWCRQILKGLYFLHSRTPPIIHRDLKCDNIFITGTTGCVKIGDLGLATLKSGSFAKSVIGTPEFMAPEMYEERYDEAVDVYAFGMCMLEMATSEYPYNECTVPAAIYKKVVSGVKPASYDKVADEKVRAIIGRCIMLNKADRPSCKELLNSEFFSEDIGLQLQPFSREAFVSDPQCRRIEFRLKLLDSKRRQQRHREDEAIQFYFELGTDQPELVARQMCEANLVGEEDAQTVAKLLHFQITSMLKERKERAAVAASADCEKMEAGSGGGGRPVVVSEPIQVPLVAESRCNGGGLMSMAAAESSPLQSPSATQRLMSPTASTGSTLMPLDVAATPPKAKRTSRQSDPMVPKLQVLLVDGRMVECSMECMQKTITFKFDMEDVDADEVAGRLITQELLDETQRRVFAELVNDIVRTEEQRRSRPDTLSFGSE